MAPDWEIFASLEWREGALQWLFSLFYNFHSAAPDTFDKKGWAGNWGILTGGGLEEHRQLQRAELLIISWEISNIMNIAAFEMTHTSRRILYFIIPHSCPRGSWPPYSPSPNGLCPRTRSCCWPPSPWPSWPFKNSDKLNNPALVTVFHHCVILVLRQRSRTQVGSRKAAIILSKTECDYVVLEVSNLVSREEKHRIHVYQDSILRYKSDFQSRIYYKKVAEKTFTEFWKGSFDLHSTVSFI